MKVTFVHPTANLSGGARVVAMYARKLAARGHKVTIVSTPRARQPLLWKFKSLLKGRGWPRDPGQASHFDSLGSVEHRLLESARPVSAGDVPDADVVIGAWWRCAEWVAALPASKGARVFFVQGYAPVQPSRDAVRATWRLDMVKIVVSPWLARVGGDLGAGDIVVVPNSVDCGQFYAAQRTKNGMPTFGFVYSPSRIKGCDISIAALRAARSGHGQFRVVAFGPGFPSSSVPLPRWVRYTRQPPQDSLRLLYAQCDAWLAPSRCEGFGLPMLEAMACRTPVIATRAGAAPELLADGGGLLVHAMHPDAMAAAIERVVRMPGEEWQRMSDAAYARATRYTWDDATDLFEAALYRAIEREGRTVPRAERVRAHTG